jgi:hypothetical protein
MSVIAESLLSPECDSVLSSEGSEPLDVFGSCPYVVVTDLDR